MVPQELELAIGVTIIAYDLDYCNKLKHANNRVSIQNFVYKILLEEHQTNTSMPYETKYPTFKQKCEGSLINCLLK